MPTKKKFLVVFASMLIVNLLVGQQWSWATQLDGEGNEACRAIVHNATGGWIAGGAFDDSIIMGEENINSSGGTDYFLASFSSDQQLEWYLTGGGIEDDFISAIDILPDGDIVCTGAFWFEMTFADSLISSTDSPRALFTARLSPLGELRWIQIHDGDGLKEINGVAARDDDKIAIAGFWERSLQLVDSTLISGTEDETTYSFAALLSGEGNLEWVQSGGGNKATRANDVDVLPDGSVVIGGFFNDTTTIADTLLIANSFDRDVFLAVYNPDGEALWARKAGGVIDEELSALTVDEEGNIYATGQMVGVMSLGNNISIQTDDGNPDFFLIKYNSEGVPQWGRGEHGASPKQGLDIRAREGLVVVGGIFQGNLIVDDKQLNTGQTPNAFIAGFNTEGEIRWLTEVDADNFSNASSISISETQRVLVGGGFGNTAFFDQQTFNSTGSTNLYMAQLWPAFTPVEEKFKTIFPIKVYPNPTQSVVYMEYQGNPLLFPYRLLLHNEQGSVLYEEVLQLIPGREIELNLNNFPSGTYIWSIWRYDQLVGSGQIIKARSTE
ncbi:MAG: hypothetical protein MI974_28465 [Chitinophagales bacterium]|nr:hypothetical protein [Chitinophagales bacterium]